MASGQSGRVARDVELLHGSGTVAGMSDKELLGRFTARRDAAAELAFEAIVARHGPMVLGVCRHVLREPHDVDDAFQATFLILVRKAGSVRVGDSLGPWLYGVAYRVALKARTSAGRRRRRESSGVAAEASAPVATDDPEAIDVRPVLYEELNRLPEKYRSPVVLCHLEGLTHEEAARELRWPVGTLSGRLSRARDLLRSRLSRRGLGVTASALAASLSPRRATASVPPALLGQTVRTAARVAAGETVSATVWKLTQGVLIAMLLNKLKLALVVASSVGVLAVGVGLAFSQTPAARPAAVSSPVADAGAPPAVQGKVSRVDAENTRVEITIGSDDGLVVGHELYLYRTRPRPEYLCRVKIAAIDPDKSSAGVIGKTVNGQKIRKGDLVSATLPDKAIKAPDGEALGGDDTKEKEAGPSEKPTFINAGATDSVVVTHAPEPNAVCAVSLRHNELQRYEAPEGTKVNWVLLNDVVAVIQEGPAVSEIAVFDGGRNAWKVERLKAPAKRIDGPFFQDQGVAYVGGRYAYAYRKGIGTWAAVELKNDGDALVRTSAQAILVQQGKYLYVYSFANGTWSKGIPTGPSPTMNASRTMSIQQGGMTGQSGARFR